MISINSEPESLEYSEILRKDVNFLRLPRKPFLDFSCMNLQNLSFGKTAVEGWNYNTIIEELFAKKANGLEKLELSKLEVIKTDILRILASCFELSDTCIPHEVSLNLVKGVPCTKLHADFLPLRLICTYVGPGTIFLPKESTRYPCLNEGRANKRVLIKGKPMLQSEPFEILLLKGRKFNKGEFRPCAHRSPEVDKGQDRLVLKVDFK